MSDYQSQPNEDNEDNEDSMLSVMYADEDVVTLWIVEGDTQPLSIDDLPFAAWDDEDELETA